ncbi:hypothetical protein D3C72_1926040 [compost metagenome]
MPHATLWVVSLVNHLNAAVIHRAIGGGDALKSTLKAVIETGDFIPGTKITLCIKIVDDGNAIWRGRGTTGHH